MRICLLALALAFAASPAAAEQYYKWKDDKGAWHYTTTPPPAGTQTERVAVRDAAGSAAASLEPSAPAPTDGGADASGDDAAEIKSLAERRQRACVQAREAAKTFEDNPAVSLDTNGDGKPEVLTVEQHAAELRRARDLVRAYCTDGA